MEHREYLEQKLKSLKRKFENNKELAGKLLAQKKIVDQKMQELTNSGALILAKVSAIQEMLNE